MHQGKYYSLTSHAYSDYLKCMMKELMMNEEYSDVTLVTEDKKQIKANTSILRACSPVFKDILKKEKHSSTIIYLRGVQFSEMESIIQFIYLGEATFYEERMEKFLAVAKSLEIKELCDAVNESKVEPEHVPLPSDSVTSTEETEENFEEEMAIADNVKVEVQQEKEKNYVVANNCRFECDQCDKTYLDRHSLKKHIQSAHEGLRYPCDLCDYQATKMNHLKVHIQSVHEAVKFVCEHCEHNFTQKCNLRSHIKNKRCFLRHGRKPNPKPSATGTPSKGPIRKAPKCFEK